MSNDSHLSESARLAYAAGVDPLDHAVHEITTLAGVHRQLLAHARACCGCIIAGDLSDGALARRILGLLISAGWTPPGGLEAPDFPEGPETPEVPL